MDTTEQGSARDPADLTRLFVVRTNVRDAGGMAALYEEGAVLGACRDLVARGVRFTLEQQLPIVRLGELALASNISADRVGVHAQVLRRQGDGRGLRAIDRPEAF